MIIELSVCLYESGYLDSKYGSQLGSTVTALNRALLLATEAFSYLLDSDGAFVPMGEEAENIVARTEKPERFKFRQACTQILFSLGGTVLGCILS
jgi:hypothetical protein